MDFLRVLDQAMAESGLAAREQKASLEWLTPGGSLLSATCIFDGRPMHSLSTVLTASGVEASCRFVRSAFRHAAGFLRESQVRLDGAPRRLRTHGACSEWQRVRMEEAEHNHQSGEGNEHADDLRREFAPAFGAPEVAFGATRRFVVEDVAASCATDVVHRSG